MKSQPGGSENQRKKKVILIVPLCTCDRNLSGRLNNREASRAGKYGSEIQLKVNSISSTLHHKHCRLSKESDELKKKHLNFRHDFPGETIAAGGGFAQLYRLSGFCLKFTCT